MPTANDLASAVLPSASEGHSGPLGSGPLTRAHMSHIRDQPPMARGALPTQSAGRPTCNLLKMATRAQGEVAILTGRTSTATRLHKPRHSKHMRHCPSPRPTVPGLRQDGHPLSPSPSPPSRPSRPPAQYGGWSGLGLPPSTHSRSSHTGDHDGRDHQAAQDAHARNMGGEHLEPTQDRHGPEAITSEAAATCGLHPAFATRLPSPVKMLTPTGTQ